MEYSDTWLKRTPTGPKKYDRFNQVSALEGVRFSQVSKIKDRKIFPRGGRAKNPHGDFPT